MSATPIPTPTPTPTPTPGHGPDATQPAPTPARLPASAQPAPGPTPGLAVAPTPRPQGRVLALDVGDRRIGVAVGSPAGGLAQPLEVITRPRDDAGMGVVFRRLREIARHEETATIVVGDPVNMDGSVGPRAEISREFARRLQGAMRQARIVLQDERLSSFTADEWMARDGVRAAQRKGRRDAYAAAVILLDYFARLRAEEPAATGGAEQARGTGEEGREEAR